MKNIYFDFDVPKRLSEDIVLLIIMHLKTIPALVDVQQLAVKFTQVSWYCCKPFTDVQWCQLLLEQTPFYVVND